MPQKKVAGTIPFDEDVGGDSIASDLWKQWHHVLHGIPVDKFSAWKVPPPPVTGDELIVNHEVQVLAFVFNSSEEFETWMNRENAQDGLQYRRVCHTTREKSASEYLMFQCHKSGKVRIKNEDRKRKFREGKSKKLGYVCSSKLIVRKHGKDAHVNWKKLNGRKDADGFLTDTERVPVSSGQTSVLYHHTHSHPVIDENVVRETPISEQTRKVVRVWRALGMSVDEIYDNLVLSRDSAHSEALGLGAPTAREKQISKRDLRNILVACNMYRRDAPRQDDITDNDIRAGELLVKELKDTYGTGEGPIPPPLWGQPHPVEDAQAAHAMIKIYQNLSEASVHMDELVGSMERAEMFLSFKQRVDIIRTSMLMTTCKRLLFPNFPGFSGGPNVSENDENLGLASGFQFQTAPPKGGKHESQQHYVV